MFKFLICKSSPSHGKIIMESNYIYSVIGVLRFPAQFHIEVSPGGRCVCSWESNLDHQVAEDAALNDSALFEFCTDLYLQPFDYLMVAVSWDRVVRVVIFQSTDGWRKFLIGSNQV